MTALFSITIFIGAALLFVVQPLVGKMVLPRVGGSPEVWNTCMVFFQVSLLAGYAYAHGLQRVGRGGGGVQVGVHAAALAVGAIVLPFALPREWAPGGSTPGSPAWAIIVLLSGMVALPLVVVATTGPLLQRWYTMARARHAGDPYFLYAGSNAGSMLGLLAYPVLVEPSLTLRAQAVAWACGYAVYAVLVLMCAAAMLRGMRGGAAGDGAGVAAGRGVEAHASPTWARRGHWLVLSLVPSSLCLGATHYLSTDVAAVPFLWVLPLAVYLLTFIIAYSRRPLPAWAMATGLVATAVAGAIMQIRVDHPGIAGIIALHLAILFFGGSLCHGELARLRPATSSLTEYYLIVSLGGALGGAFNALLAPVIFDAVWEYPLAIVAAILLTPTRVGAVGAMRQARAAAVGGVAAAAVIVGVLFAATILGRDYGGRVIHRERTFFGVHVVARSEVLSALGKPVVYHTLWHGTTNHGVQQMEPAAQRSVPRAYFHRESPIGSIFAVGQVDEFFNRLAARRREFDGTELVRPRVQRVAIVGMGAGTLAAYSRAGDEYTFYEIDPEVDRMARDPRLFAFVPEAKGTIRTVIGDGRVRMAEAPDGSYDLIILDAFSSDAIPYHLITREALAMYLRKLAPGGIVAVHVSNVHLDLPPVVGSGAAEAGASAIVWHYEASDEQLRQAMSSATWVALARSEADLVALNFGPGTWEPLEPRAGVRGWTDDYSNLLGALKSKGR
ncbi:MAG: spermidine synthase [Phycisphaerales bacterium]